MVNVYDADIQITMRGVSDPVGLPYTVNPFELVDREALIELREGPTGEQGPQGDPAWPWQWQGDIANFTTLQALGLGTGDARKAWRVVDEEAIYLWTGLEFIRFLNAFGAAGRQGPPNVLTGAAAAGAVGSSAAAALTGTAPNQQLEITIPRGTTGAVGDPGVAGNISDAADVVAPTDSRSDAVLSWDDTADLWEPVPNPKLGGPWAIASGQFAAGSNLSAPSKTIATLTVPAQPIAWRPIILAGNITLRVHVASFDDTRVIVEVRLGSIDGPVIGFGFALGASNEAFIQLASRWELALDPDSDHATVAPNQTATLYVIVKRVSGVKNYTVVNQGAQMIVMAQALRNQP